jgi:tripartite-type tricarboxylate transporter receptor subunit TctC
MISSRSSIVAGAAGALLLAGCGAGGPETGSAGPDYPTNDVRIIVPYTAGGPTDLAARASSQCLSEELGQPFVVENLEGGAGAIGMTEMVTAEPDGYTLGIGTIGNMVVAPMVGEGVQYTLDDLTPIGKIYEIPSVLVLPSGSQYESVEELVAAAEAAPDTIRIATPGASTLYHIALQRLAEDYGVQFNLVPFNGSSEAVTAFLGGNVDGMFLEASDTTLALVESGDGRAVATGAPEPLEFLEGVPTLASLGYEELPNSSAFFALTAPTGTPQDVLDVLTESLTTCLEDPAVIERLRDDYVPDEFVGTEQLESELAEAHEIYSEVL